ncbi:hypothetical protein Tco_1575323 [Tanacetum coccineum]
MHENFHGTEGTVGLTRWFEKLESQFGINNVSEADRVKFASTILLDGALTWWNVNEIKQMENELWNLKVKGTNLTAYNQRFHELILLCPEMVSNVDRLLERYIEGLPLSIKGNVTSSKPVDLHEAIDMAHESVDDTTLTHALLLITTMERQDIRPRTAELHLALQTKEDPESKEDREVMSLVLDVAKKDITRTGVRTMGIKAVEIKFEATRKTLRTIRGRIKGTLREVTKYRPALKEDAEHLAEYTAYVLRLL